MKEKLIIENQTDLKMFDILPYVEEVVLQGKISRTGKGKQYCFVTIFSDGIRVSAFKNDKSDRLVIWKDDRS